MQHIRRERKSPDLSLFVLKKQKIRNRKRGKFEFFSNISREKLAKPTASLYQKKLTIYDVDDNKEHMI